MHGNFDGEEFGQAIVESIKAGLRRSNSAAPRLGQKLRCSSDATFHTNHRELKNPAISLRHFARVYVISPKLGSDPGRHRGGDVRFLPIADIPLAPTNVGSGVKQIFD
jgi:hypothetical protein